MKSQKPAKLVVIGKVIGAKGLKGELKIFLAAGQADWHTKTTTVYFKADKEDPRPFSLEAVRGTAGRFSMSVREIKSRDEADSCKGLSILVDDSLFTAKKGETFFLREILGYSVLNAGQIVGRVSGFDSNVAQDLLVLEVDGGTALVPFVKAFILRIDDKTRTIEMNLPDGLIEANLRDDSSDRGDR